MQGYQSVPLEIHATVDTLDTLAAKSIKSIKGFKIIKGSKGISTATASACRAEGRCALVLFRGSRAEELATWIAHCHCAGLGTSKEHFPRSATGMQTVKNCR